MADQSLRVRLLAVTAGFTRGMNTASNQLKSFGAKAKSVGSSLKSIQLPLALAGGAAVKLSMDFDKSMTQIQTLVGISADKVAQMGEAAKKMALNTGQSANDAAEALFFITSAGLRGEEAMQVLESSLKAAALGMGEAKTIADLATSAMNAYGSETLSASGATDVLGAAVREGKLEASELAGAMGRVLPMASNMGIKFNEVGAAFAAMSRTGTNANEAATQLNAIMMAIMKPTKEATERMTELGLSSQGLRQQIKEKGLLSVLQTLKEAYGRNAEAAEVVFGGQRSLRGILDLVGSSAEATTQIFNNMNNTAGFTDEAFKTLEEKSFFKFKKALESVKTSLIALGGTILNAILPVVQKLTGFITTLFQKFQNLNPTVKGLVLAAGGLVLVLPTVLSLLGTIASALGALLSPVSLVIAAFAAVGYAVVKNWEPVKKTIVSVINYVISLYNESLAFRIIIQSIGAIFKSIFEIGKSVFEGLWNIVKALGQNFINQFKAIGKVIKGVFTLDAEMIKQGVKDSLNSAFGTFKTIANEAGDKVKNAGQIVHDNLKSGFEKAMVSEPLEFVSESDVDNFVGGIKDKVVNAGKQIAGFFQTGTKEGGTGVVAATGEGGAEPFQLGSFGGATEGLNLAGESLNLIGNSVDSVTQKFAQMKEFVSENAEMIGDSLFNAFNTLMNAENPLKALGQMIMQLVKKMLAAAAAALILSALLPGMGATSFKGGGVDFKSIMGTFTGMKFANGGIVSSPTLGMVGEYSGARQNPEVIAPLDRLKSILGDSAGQRQVQVGGEFKLRGEDLLVSLERAEKQRNRTS